MQMVAVIFVLSRAAQNLSAGRMRPAGRRLDSTALEYRDETPTKTRGMELRCGENFIILTSTVFTRDAL